MLVEKHQKRGNNTSRNHPKRNVFAKKELMSMRNAPQGANTIYAYPQKMAKRRHRTHNNQFSSFAKSGLHHRNPTKMSAKDVSEEHNRTTPVVRTMDSPMGSPMFHLETGKSSIDDSIKLRELVHNRQARQ